MEFTYLVDGHHDFNLNLSDLWPGVEKKIFTEIYINFTPFTHKLYSLAVWNQEIYNILSPYPTSCYTYHFSTQFLPNKKYRYMYQYVFSGTCHICECPSSLLPPPPNKKNGGGVESNYWSRMWKSHVFFSGELINR